MDMNLIQGLLSSNQPQQPMISGLLQSKIQNFDPARYATLTSDNQNLNVDYKPLNFNRLLESGAFRVTNQGLPSGGFNPDPTAGFSLVSAYNDLFGNQSSTWQDNPMAYDVVRQMMTQRPADIGAHKYLQILQSARDLGLTDSDIFLNR